MSGSAQNKSPLVLTTAQRGRGAGGIKGGRGGEQQGAQKGRLLTGHVYLLPSLMASSSLSVCHIFQELDGEDVLTVWQHW